MKIEGNGTLQAQAMHQLQQQRLQKNNEVREGSCHDRYQAVDCCTIDEAIRIATDCFRSKNP